MFQLIGSIVFGIIALAWVIMMLYQNNKLNKESK